VAPSALEVEADLHLTGPSGEPFRLVARGSRLALILPSLGAGWRLARSAPPRDSTSMLATLSAALWGAGLTLEVVDGPYEVARLGWGTQPTPLSRWLGLWPSEVRAGRLLRALFRSEPRP